MKLHIAEQIIEIEAGEGRIRFDLIKDEPVEAPVPSVTVATGEEPVVVEPAPVDAPTAPAEPVEAA